MNCRSLIFWLNCLCFCGCCCCCCDCSYLPCNLSCCFWWSEDINQDLICYCTDKILITRSYLKNLSFCCMCLMSLNQCSSFSELPYMSLLLLYGKNITRYPESIRFISRDGLIDSCFMSLSFPTWHNIIWPLTAFMHRFIFKTSFKGWKIWNKIKTSGCILLHHSTQKRTRIMGSYLELNW